MKALLTGLMFGVLALAPAAPGGDERPRPAPRKKKMDTRVFEMRTYYAAPGKMTALHARFRNHTNKLFEKHGMTTIGFWVPIDPKGAEVKLVYILAYPSKASADASWKAFREDPVWIKAKDASEKDGKLV